MDDTSPTIPRAEPPGRGWVTLLGAVLFAAAHTQAPHVYSNQNQYYLHGLAAAGFGDLRADWLSTTADPTPVFSAVVATAYEYAGLGLLRAVYFVVLMAYFLGLMRVAGKLTFRPTTPTGRVALAAGLILAHSAVIRVASVELFGKDFPWFAQAGIANQYVLGPVFQPSVAGVGLILALAAFAHQRPRLAGVLVALTCIAHSTYLLPGALLIAGMLYSLARSGRTGAAVATGGLALLGVLPVLAYILTTFGPTSAGQFSTAQEIVAWGRIPHHTEPSVWLDWIAGVQILGMLLGVLAYRRSGLFVVLAAATVASVGLTLVSVATESAMLALLFPWRLSVILMPLATLAAAAAFARLLDRWLPPSALAVTAGLTAIAAAAGSVAVVAMGLGYQETLAEDGMLRFVAATRRPGERYLLPTQFPGPPGGRGVESNSFLPEYPGLDRPNNFSLQRFRLGTGAAAYIDFKSIPYKDTDVIEWRKRVADVERWYRTPDWDASGVINEVTSADVGATHVVVPITTRVRSERFVLVHHDPAYDVFRIDLPADD